MRARSRILSLAGLALLSTPLLAGLYVASRAVAPPTPRKYKVPLHGITEHQATPCLVLERSERTSSPGTFSIWYEGGHAQLGRVLHRDASTIAREIIRIDGGDLGGATHGAWSGHAYVSPATLGLASVDVEIDTEYGAAPAWRIDPPEAVETPAWAIHIHGLGSSRSGMLRGVIAATKANMVSLVVTYRNDGEGPSTLGGRSTLGMDEADDVGEALEYAVAHGARRVILFGWSMGANIALKLMVESRHKDHVVGVIAISPVLDWKQTLRSNCSRAGLPAFVGSIAACVLTTPVGAEAVRLPHALRLDQLNWIGRAAELDRPILLIHGTDDSSVPIGLSRRLVQEAGTLITLLEFRSEHTLEWNAYPERWQDGVIAWIAGLDRNADGRG